MLDGMLDHSEFVRMTKDELRNLIGTPPDRLYEAEIRKACRVVGRFITSPVSDDGNGDALGAAVEHLEALFEMDSEPGNGEAADTNPRPKKGSGGNAPEKKANVSSLSAPEVTSRWGDRP